jgi:8-oxo-dGTP pyrophosphatase MutT (NUDIX family)
MLDLKLDRDGVPPKPAATLILVRDAEGGDAVEVFCVQRSGKSAFMGGAIVFPGGKVDPSDSEDGWLEHVVDVDAELRAHRIAACRESLEEAAILPVDGGALGDAELEALRRTHADDKAALRAFLSSRGLRIDLRALHPFSHWVTPTAESRRYDTYFFVAKAPEGQSGAHDQTETTASFWATPAEVLRRFEAGEVQLAPPTHRTLDILTACRSASDVVTLASQANLDPICPRLVPQGDTMALVLPGDREHDVRETRTAGTTRYVLRGERWQSEDAPA